MKQQVKQIVQDTLDYMADRGPNAETWSVDLYLDHRDIDMGEYAIKMIASADDPRGMFSETIDEAFRENCWQEERDLLSALKQNLSEASLEYDEDELREYIQEHVYINIPTDEILSKNEVCVNIIVDTGDADYEFTKNSFAHSYYGSGEGIEDESSLLWLAKQQGSTEDDLRRAFREGAAFDAESLRIQSEYQQAEKALEDLGKRDFYGYRNDLDQGPYKQFKHIQDEISKCTVQISRDEKALSEVPATYKDYLKACDERGARMRMSEESFSLKRGEIIEKAAGRIQANRDWISALKEEIIEKNLEPVQEAVEVYKSAVFKHLELTQTEEYKKCRLLDSLIESSASTTSGMNALTFCVKMSLSDYLDLRDAMEREKSLNKSSDPEERTGTGEVVLSSTTHAILYDAWSGAGSSADIELCADVHLPIRLIDSATPDGIDGYGVKEIYGVDSSLYRDSLIGISPMKEMERPEPKDQSNLDAEIKTSKADTLSEGWTWKDFHDGSGSLHDPDGKTILAYDVHPVSTPEGPEVEYRYEAGTWNTFYGTLSEFKEFAENIVNDKLSSKSLSAKIAAAQQKVEEKACDSDRTPGRTTKEPERES